MDIMTIIEAQRALQDIDKHKLASAVDITPEYYSKLLSGKSQPSWPVAVKMLQILKLRLFVAENAGFFEVLTVKENNNHSEQQTNIHTNVPCIT